MASEAALKKYRAEYKGKSDSELLQKINETAHMPHSSEYVAAAQLLRERDSKLLSKRFWWVFGVAFLSLVATLYSIFCT